jgi:predicted Zn-dependent peptidase
MLSLILFEGNKKYNTRRLVDIECENLYNVVLSGGSIISGNANILSFSTSFLNEKYTEKGMNEKSFKFFLDFIFNPDVENDKFNEKSYVNARNILKEDIETYYENPNRYAISELYKTMCPNLPLSYPSTGYMEDLDKLNEEKLYKYYKEILNTNSIDIFVIGDIDIPKFRKIIEDNFVIPNTKRKKINHFLKQSNYLEKPRSIKKSRDINQGILLIGSKLKNINNKDRLYTLAIYNYILGGGPDSKLFREVREKNSLCYSISSTYAGVSSIELIRSGIDSKNYKKTLKLILEQVEEMKKGNFTDKDVETAKLNMLAALKEIEDSPSGILNLYEAHEYLGYELLEERKEVIKSITKKDVLDITKKIKLDTIFLLEGSKRK